MTWNVRLSSAAVCLAFSVGIAHAAPNDQTGLYSILSVGRSNLGLKSSDIDNALFGQGITGSTSLDKSDTSKGANIGYRFNSKFAIEGGYADFGSFKYSTSTTAPGADTINGSYKASAWSLAGVGFFPMGRDISLFAKAGLARTEGNLSTATTTGATAPTNASNTGTGLLIGAGVTYDFTREIFGTAGWDHYTRIGNVSTGRGEADLYTVGIGFRY